MRAAAAKLDEIFPRGAIGELVEQQPLLLLEDVDDAIAELRRYFKSSLQKTLPASLDQQENWRYLQPFRITSVPRQLILNSMVVRQLSACIRLLKQDDVVGMLIKDPGLLTTVVSNRKLSIW